MATAKEYTKLPGKGWQVIWRSRLWLARDHLLLITTTGYSESYRRFYMKDIRGLTITRNPTRLVINIIVLSLAALFLLPCLLIREEAVIYVFGFFVAIFLLISLVNSLRGPTCTTLISTAVQSEPLPPLARVRVAERFLARVSPLILAAQQAAVPSTPEFAPTPAASPSSGE
jgi:hypothetical protein